MRKINHQQLKSFLYTAYKTRTPTFIWGTMGIGKSMSVRDIAKTIADKYKFKFCDNEINGKDSFCFVDVRISQLDPSDLRGLPTVKGDTTKWLPPNWLPQDPKSKGILFFDELNLAPQSIQASSYQLILDRRLGDYKLPDGWVIISAGNTSEDRANVFDLPAPLSNRFVHIELAVPTKEEWTGWALQNNIHGSIISFLELKPSFLYTFDKKKSEKAFATPRTWDYVSRLLRGSEKKDLDEKEILIASAVGEAIAIEFVAHLRLQKQINLDEILDKPETVTTLKGLDLKYSLLGAIVEKYREDKKVLAKACNLALYLDPEYAILLLRFLKSVHSTFVKDVIKVPVWNKIYEKYGKYLISSR